MPRSQIIGHHLIWTLYGHWLPNDPRGSGSQEVRREQIAELGPLYVGRRPEPKQPSREELRAFHQQAEARLSFPRFWLDAAKRKDCGLSLAEIISQRSYTVWAGAILSNHMHLVIRKHRDDALQMWHQIADSLRLRLREFQDIGPLHPVWSERPYKVYLKTPEEVRSRVTYVQRNPAKENLPSQHFDFVQEYNNWPFHKQT